MLFQCSECIEKCLQYHTFFVNFFQNHTQRARLECKKHKRSRQSHASKDKYSQNMIAKEESVGFYPSLQYGGAVPRISNHVQPESQPIRPNSLDLHSSYFNRQQAPFSDGTKPQYPPPPPAYTEHPISPQQHYPPPPYVAITPERQVAASPNGTPTRGVYRVNSRPSQPPPAPPALSSASSSGSSTPTVSAGTPSSSGSRYKYHQKRDNLPPPPPPPVSTSAEPPGSTVQSPTRNGGEQSILEAVLAVIPPSSPKEKEEKEAEAESGASSSSGTEVSLEKAAAEAEAEVPKEAELPPPPPLPPAMDVQTSVSASPAHHHHHPPPPPPPPLPPLEDLVLDITDSGSLSENQNIEVVSITSESASETSSVSKLSEQHFDGKAKLSGPKDGRSDLLAAIREGKVGPSGASIS